jgi:hypothetical protein
MKVVVGEFADFFLLLCPTACPMSQLMVVFNEGILDEYAKKVLSSEHLGR